MKRFLVTAALSATVWVAHGQLYPFSAITINDPDGFAPAAGETQLYMGVSLLGGGQASFVFTNAGPESSSISLISFDFAPEINLELSSISNGYGVDFVTGSGKNLPSGKDLDEIFISALSVEARKPTPLDGINPYESLELLMSYDGAYDLFGALENEDLRVGLHVQDFAGGYSESFINVPEYQDVIPEPGTFSIMLIGGFALRWFRRLK
jgi:hypothetical protein